MRVIPIKLVIYKVQNGCCWCWINTQGDEMKDKRTRRKGFLLIGFERECRTETVQQKMVSIYLGCVHFT